MELLNYRGNELYFGEMSLAEVARQFPTPFYLYSEREIVSRLSRLKSAFQNVKLPCDLHYSVKANPLLGILNVLRSNGASFDVVSLGEAERCLAAGANPQQIVFSGSGKSESEIRFGIEKQIRMINVESESELIDVIRVAQELKMRAPVALRINPDVDALTHEYITTGTHDTKFGVSVNRALDLYFKYQHEKSLDWVGLDMHIGSQLTVREPIQRALKIFSGVASDLVQKGFQLRFLDIGGGLGISYGSESVISETEFAQMVKDAFTGFDFSQARLLMEPGRFIVGPAGVLVSRILHKKSQIQKQFLILDAGMTELIRPALYEAQHRILAVTKTSAETRPYQIVGPICESSDQFLEDCILSIPNKGDVLVIADSGAYGVSMESNYNSRPKSLQLLLESSGKLKVLREREALRDLWRLESL